MSAFLHAVPNEILDHIAFHLAATIPYALPDPLLPLRYASTTLCLRLDPRANPSLYARIYRLKFDDSAVRRRAFAPEAENYAEHFVHSCKALAAIRDREFQADDPGPVLFAAYLMMLDNDGKNRTQLEWAGIELYLDLYVRTCMYSPDERMPNNGWPQDTAANACALWLMWMFTTPEKLQAESIEEREQLAQLVLPFVSIPFRYTSAHAPPMHYVIPPSNSENDNDDDNFFSIQTAHGQYPIYRRPESAWSQVYYGSRPLLMYPLAAEAAKLIYQSRRDMALLTVPPHHPRTRADAIAAGITGVFPTQEDVAEVNAHKSAQTVKRVIWDWERGIAVVPGADDAAEYNASRDWDCDWWRLRFCWDVWKSQPQWRPGKVYVPGSLSGLWQGKMLIPSEQHMTTFLHAPSYPLPFFSETTLLMTSRPIYMRLTEHHCLIQNPRIPVVRQKIGPFHDDGVQNAWFPGPPGSLRWEEFTDHRSGKQNIALYTYSGHTTQYQTFSPENAGTDWSGYDHDQDSCFGCRARAELIESAALNERRKLEEEQQRETEKAFASVGLGRENTVPFQFGDSGMDIDGEDEDDEDGDSDVMDECEYYVDADIPPVRKTHDWIRNVVECDGVKDVMVTGAVSGVSTLPTSTLIPFAD
ncbi:hypothetical protein AX14_013779 [Amanita brunnescens Koide BX004]|nr:hypothetical protein AX14_013779 [Amanita brunnescens Koide BX004]